MKSNSPLPCARSWSVSEDWLRRYVFFASESYIQELFSASDSNRAGNDNVGWKPLAFENDVEISKRGSGPFHTFRSRWLLKAVSPEQFITVANAIDAAKIVAVASLPKEIAAGLQPKQKNSIRGLLLQSGWVVEKLEDDSCMLTYVVQLDPAGWLPKCFVNRLNTKLVMIIENLRKQAQASYSTSPHSHLVVLMILLVHFNNCLSSLKKNIELVHQIYATTIILNDLSVCVSLNNLFGHEKLKTFELFID